MRKRVMIAITITAAMSAGLLLSLTGCGDTPVQQTGEEYFLPGPKPSENKAPIAPAQGSGDKTGQDAVGDKPQTVSDDVVAGADTGRDDMYLPVGAREVKDPVTGETRYRVRGEDPSDPRTYTYEQVWAEEGQFPVGMEQYDAQDTDPHHVRVKNLEAISDFTDDSYLQANLRVFLANYLYYFTQDRNAHYDATIFESLVHNNEKGLIVFDVIVDKYPDTKIHCEYNPVQRLFGFDSSLGDMSLDVQYAIAGDGKAVSRKTLLEYAPEKESVSENSVSGNETEESAED